jgi:hypothetical protein
MHKVAKTGEEAEVEQDDEDTAREAEREDAR